MTRPQVGLLDGFSDADRENRFYVRFGAVWDDGGRFPPVRSLARIFFPRRNLQVFTSNPGAAPISVLLIDPALITGGRRARFGPGLWPGPLRQARQDTPGF
jgi:hypothetical protein